MQFFSFIIPIYNRPEELEELLGSFLLLEPCPQAEYEVIVVEDGSTLTSASVVQRYTEQLPLKYLTQANTGPSGARNYGASEAKGEWFVFLDSDTILPPHYLVAVTNELAQEECQLWGGPDRARADFTIVQKAIDYSMTSPLTTGGIRGGAKKRLDMFYPRTFNLGVRKELYNRVGGFREDMRYGEDLDFSMRVLATGATSRLLPSAWLYHKRRATYASFFRQVNHSGRARVRLEALHPGTFKWVHLLPTLFVVYNVVALILFWTPLHIPLLLYLLLIVGHVFAKEGSMALAFHAVAATYVQFFAYGTGVVQAYFNKKL